MRRIIYIFIIALFVSACATNPVVLPEKYNLDSSLKEVGQIKVSVVRDFENVDNQSVILEADRDEYYLLVLRRPIDVEYSNLSISVETSVSKDRERSTQEIIGSKTTSKGVPSTEFVQAPSKITRIVSGSDRIIVIEKSVEREYYVIERIYRLEGRDQADQIKDWLRRN